MGHGAGGVSDDRERRAGMREERKCMTCGRPCDTKSRAGADVRACLLWSPEGCMPAEPLTVSKDGGLWKEEPAEDAPDRVPMRLLWSAEMIMVPKFEMAACPTLSLKGMREYGAKRAGYGVPYDEEPE